MQQQCSRDEGDALGVAHLLVVKGVAAGQLVEDLLSPLIPEEVVGWEGAGEVSLDVGVEATGLWRGVR